MTIFGPGHAVAPLLALDMTYVLDILHEDPHRRGGSRRLSEALTFGFARGVEESVLLALVEPSSTESTFRRESFEADLFIDEFIEGCTSIKSQGRRYEAHAPHLKRLLVTPPSQVGDTRFRQSIFAELCAKSELVEGMERAYAKLRGFRAALVGLDALGGRTHGVQRRIDILGQLRRTIDELAGAFAGSETGLRRVTDWCEEVRCSEPFLRLERLLAFEDRRSVLETRLQVGYDGSLRRFEIVRVAEAEHLGFSRGPLRRFFRRVLSLLKGYRFSEEDVMSQLLDQVFSDLEDVVVDCLGVAAELEFYLAGMSFRDFAQSKGQEVCLPEFADEDGARELEASFNPWLLLQPGGVVPCNMKQAPGRCTLIVTGPNSGGKTRLLQSLAMTQLLGQVGMFVPARRARLLWVDQLFLSLLERVEAGQKEGRLGMELVRIRKVFESSGARSLIIMDELCSGTNPSEGEQIFEMVLDLLEELRPQVVISTHFLDFAGRLDQEKRPYLRFLQVELGPRDVPTYHFVPGVAETSLARNTAARLGVTREELLALVERHRTARS